tara:strand:+ start:1183 stop:1923 length:741 start_codon:yes stop_codon:yes gene_type:complete
MKNLLLSFLIILASCNKSTPPHGDPINKIMSLGASRVEGNKPNFTGPLLADQFVSFRYDLWKNIIQDGWSFDFIGSEFDFGDYPDFNNIPFDADHQGNSGFTAEDIAAGIESWLEETGAPDIVLFSSPGGNDALQNFPYNGVVDDIEYIINVLQASNPNVTIIIEQMAPTHSDEMTAELTNYINDLHQDMLLIASNKTTSTSEIIAIDMFTGFTDAMLADDVHYNELGAKFIADKYYAVLVNLLQG